jgi:hypothetical protein
MKRVSNRSRISMTHPGVCMISVPLLYICGPFGVCSAMQRVTVEKSNHESSGPRARLAA